MKNLTLHIFLLLFFCTGNQIFGQSKLSTISGIIYEIHHEYYGKIELPIATVVLRQNGEFVQGTVSDYEGNYILNNISEGEYELEISYVGRKPHKEVIKIEANEKIFIDVDLSAALTIELNIEVVTVYPQYYDREKCYCSPFWQAMKKTLKITKKSSPFLFGATLIGAFYGTKPKDLDEEKAK